MSKPFCKVCRDAGKPESEYTSHWVRTLPDRKVICPTLLSTSCRYCHKAGHTVKFCPEIKKNEKARAVVQKVVEKVKVEKVAAPVSRFAVFMDDSEDEDEVEVEEPKEKELTGWAAIAAKPKPVAVQAIPLPKPVKEVKVQVAPWVQAQPVPKKTWADWSDSEDEDEDETW